VWIGEELPTCERVSRQGAREMVGETDRRIFCKDTKKIDSQDMDETTTIPWETYSTMKDALTAGWEPGQSFSFQATNCKGQKVEPVSTEKTVLPNPLSVNNLG
jgi:hypothetical protein